MTTETHIQGPLTGQSEVCEQILRALPQWFGIESSIVDYVTAIESLPTFVAYKGEQAVGFMGLKHHGEASSEIYVMGVLPGYHRAGIGRALFEAGRSHLTSQGFGFLQVKTLSPASTDPNYARTRAFYEALGFVALEEFPTLWDPHNPCLQMIMALGRC